MTTASATVEMTTALREDPTLEFGPWRKELYKITIELMAWATGTNIYLLLHLMQKDAKYRSNPGIEQLNAQTQEATFLPRPNNPVLPDELPANASAGTASCNHHFCP